MEVRSVYYDSNKNIFEDEDGQEEYDISDIMPIDEVMAHKRVGGTYYAIVDNEMFKVEFPITLYLDKTIYYCPKDNIITDDMNNIIYNIFSVISANDLLLFKHNKEDMVVKGVCGGMINLIYSDDYCDEYIEGGF